MDKDEQIKGMEQPSRGSVGFQEAQRTWVGLTDEEISASSKGHMTRNGFARAIEAKLKEKNT
jgi:hypothetical protein